jgi:hypothetical protein
VRNISARIVSPYVSTSSGRAYICHAVASRPRVAARGIDGAVVRTNVPAPTRPVTRPISARRRYARAAVRWLTPASSASSRVGGSFSPAASSKDSIASENAPTIWLVTDSGEPRSMSVNLCLYDIDTSRDRY